MNRALFAVAAVALMLAGCAGRTSPQPPSQSDDSAGTAVRPAAAARSDASPKAAPASFVQQFGGWDSDFGDWAFRIRLRTASGGAVHGRIVFVTALNIGTSRTVASVTGSAGPPQPNGRRRLHLMVSSALTGVRSLHGWAGPNYLLLSAPEQSSHELDLFGSAAGVARGFRAHVHVLRGPGGFSGWRDRKAESRAAVHHLDIDGDGRADLVTVVWSHLANSVSGIGTLEVTVHFADGAIQALPVRTYGTTSGPQIARIGWIGSVRLPGLAGRQIVLTSAYGAANRFYGVVGEVAGRLRQIRSVNPDDDWGDGGTVGTGVMGRYCSGGVVTTWWTRAAGRRGTSLVREHVVLNRSVWRDGRWLRLAHVNAVLGNRAAASALHEGPGHGLWHCR